jgi:hypothetical protein
VNADALGRWRATPWHAGPVSPAGHGRTGPVNARAPPTPARDRRTACYPWPGPSRFLASLTHPVSTVSPARRAAVHAAAARKRHRWATDVVRATSMGHRCRFGSSSLRAEPGPGMRESIRRRQVPKRLAVWHAAGTEGTGRLARRGHGGDWRSGTPRAPRGLAVWRAAGIEETSGLARRRHGGDSRSGAPWPCDCGTLGRSEKPGS